MAKRKRQPLVAIVDDDASVREAAESLLRSEGFDTICYADAESFLRARPPRPADCLILDMHLPGISGLQLYRQLIQRRKRVPAILLTADWDSDGRLRAEASAAGMLGILYKPFDADTLIQLIRSAV